MFILNKHFRKFGKYIYLYGQALTSQIRFLGLFVVTQRETRRNWFVKLARKKGTITY